MNWDRGLKRITLVVSIASAVIAAGLGLIIEGPELIESIDDFEGEYQDKFSEFDGQILIDTWKSAKTDTEQNELWLMWTGSLLKQKAEGKPVPSILPQFSEAKSMTDFVETIKLGQNKKELDRMAWCTADGEPLPLSPEKVWQIQHRRRIKDLRSKVLDNLIGLPSAFAGGAVFGFCAIWGVYFGTKWGALPLYKWISVGFRDD